MGFGEKNGAITSWVMKISYKLTESVWVRLTFHVVKLELDLNYCYDLHSDNHDFSHGFFLHQKVSMYSKISQI